MKQLIVLNQKSQKYNSKISRTSVRPIFTGRTEFASKQAEKKKGSLKADLAEVGVLVVGIFSDAVLLIGYPLILLCQKFKKWLWKK